MSIEWNVTLFAALGIGLALGAGLGFLLRGRSGAADRARAEQLESDLEQTREELEAHRDDVARHFQQTSDLFRDVTEQYSRLYTHLASGARAFSTEAVPALGALETPLLAEQPVASNEAEGEESLEAAPDLPPESEPEPDDDTLRDEDLLEPVAPADEAPRESAAPQRTNGGLASAPPPA